MSRVESITVAPTTERKTVPGRFEAALQGATRALASGVVGAVELAAPAVPFGNVLAGAVRGGLQGSASPAGSMAIGAGGTHLSAAGVGGATSAIGAASGGTGTQGDLLEATRAMQQEAQAMNLQYLQLQERMQQESREFTTLSNVMRVKHDTARAAIGNIH
jgi:hypothetical protein